jgi:serine/threonine protein kinase
MGKVYLVRHLKLEAERALKTIVPGISSNPQWRKRFSREAKAMARLSHPHIVTVHDADVLPDGDAFIEMEFVRGQSLDRRLRANTPMPLAWVDRMLGQLCDALQVAHDMEIVHRDLKPQNLMILDGQAPGQEILKILDFGIAKILNSGDPDDNVTQLGQSLGTPNYMSPEQISGDVEAVKASSDLYSVGVLVYQLLTGHLPFSGSKSQVLMGHLCSPPPAFKEKNPRVELPREVEALVMRCLEKDPKRRPSSARALAEEFHRLVAPGSDSPRPTAPDRIPRRAWLTVAVAVGLAAIGIPLLPLFRTASPREFSVTADTSSLDLIAGGEPQHVRLQFVGTRPGTKVDVSFPEPLADVETKQVGDVFGDQYDFQVAADLNARPTPEPIDLKMRVRAGPDVRESSLRLRIVRPPIGPLPGGFEVAEGSRLQRFPDDKVYPDRVVRRLADGIEVVFRLIPSDPTPSFYIMENKVWNSLFEAYLKALPESDRGPKQDLIRRRTAREKEQGSWPAFHVTAREAQEFARWLVPGGTLRLSGNLPTAQQWDKASGFYDRESPDREHDDSGPFLAGWSPGDKDQIAVGREAEGPLPVGTATKDVSRFGCRDMAGNGMEWLRPEDDVAKQPQVVYLRGGRFDGPDPFTFKERGSERNFSHKPFRYIGFRVVIEGL